MISVGRPLEGEEPTVLLVAQGERLAPALQRRLSEHGMFVEVAAVRDAAGAAFAAAPDLIVLAGQAAHDGGHAILEQLNQNPMTSALPVLLVSGDGASDLASEFRHGVVAVLDRSASADEMARRIAEVAYDLPERTGETRGRVDANNLEDVLALVGDSLRTGILALRNEESGHASQVVLHGKKPVDKVVAEIVEKLRPLVASSAEGALSYEFHESPASRFSSIDLGQELEAAIAQLRGRSILMVEQNAARADLLTQDLRGVGARVVVVDASGEGLDIARENHPDVVLIDGSGMEGWALTVFRAIRRDTALRWASVLVVEADRLWRDARRPDLGLLAGSIEGLMRPDHELRERSAEHDAVDTRLETIGPVRTLRALLETGRSLRVHVRDARVVIDIDVMDGLIACARARSGEQMAEGPAALATLLALSNGKVRVTAVEAPRAADVMAPLDAALEAASRERGFVRPSSRPPPASRSGADLPLVPRPTDARRFVDRLDELTRDLESSEDDGRIDPVEDVVTGAMTQEAMQRLKARMRRALPPSSQGVPVVPRPLPSSNARETEARPPPRPAIDLKPGPRTDPSERATPSVPPPRRPQREPTQRLGSPPPKPGGSKPARPVPPVGRLPSASSAALPPIGRLPSASNGALRSVRQSDGALPAAALPRASRTSAIAPASSRPRGGADSRSVGARPSAPAIRTSLPSDPAEADAAYDTSTTGASVQAPVDGARIDGARIDRARIDRVPTDQLPMDRVPVEPIPIDVAVDEITAERGETRGAEAPFGQAPRQLPPVEQARMVGTFDHVSQSPATTAPLPAPLAPPERVVPLDGPPPPSGAIATVIPFDLPQPPVPARPTPSTPSPDAAHAIAQRVLEARGQSAPAPTAPNQGRFDWPDAEGAIDPFEPSTTVDPLPRGAAPPSDLFDIASGNTALDEPVVVPRRPIPWAWIGLGAFSLLVAGGAVAAYFGLRGETEPVASEELAAASGSIQVPSGATVDEAELAPTETSTEAPPSPTEAALVTDSDEVEAPTIVSEDEAPVATEEGTPDGAAAEPSPFGPGPDDPLEGSEEEFDLADLGVIAAAEEDTPDSRRARRAYLERTLNEGNQARRRGDFDEASFKYCEILGVEPGHPRATAGLARVAVETGDVENAILLAQRLVRLRSNIASNFVFLGDTLLLGQNPDAARRAFQRAAELEPHWPVPQERLAELDGEPAEE